MLKHFQFRCFTKLLIYAPSKNIASFCKSSPQRKLLKLKTCLSPSITSIPYSTTQTLEPEPCDLEEITEGCKEKEKLLKVIILEIDLLRQDGSLVPDKIEKNEWIELLLLKTRSSRQRFLTFLFKNERKRENKAMKVEAKRKERLEELKNQPENNHITYGFSGSTIFLRIYDSTIDSAMNSKLINAAQFSQHIVMDLSYDNEMTRLENRNCAKQLCMSFSINRNHPQPFHFQFCNANPNSFLMHCLQNFIPPMHEPHYPFFITEKSYLDLYPKERLVYLTPHCREDLIEYNHDDVYIIGGMVDKAISKPLSLARAKEYGLRMAKLPLDRFLLWGSCSSKSLTLNQVLAIMLDMRMYNDWSVAFQHVPKRKIVSQEQLRDEALKDLRRQAPKPFKRPYKGINEKNVYMSSDMIRKIGFKKENVT